MADVKLEQLPGTHDDGALTVMDIQNGPWVPMPGEGEVNLLCGHCDFALARDLVSMASFESTAPGVTFRCPECRKYSLLRDEAALGWGSGVG